MAQPQQQSGQQDQPKTARQEIQERKIEAGRQQAVAKGKEMQKDMEKAESFEQQKQVQNVVIGAMAYVPGFDVYNVALKDVAFYKPYSIYGNQKTIDNRRASRALFGATDKVHSDMVQEQYELRK